MSYYKDQQKCFQWLDKIIMSIDGENTLDLATIYIQAQNLFPVSVKSLDKRIQLYIEAGMVEQKGNLLKKPKLN